MILLDGPYISKFLLQTIMKNNFPVIKNAFAENLGHDHFSFVEQQAAAAQLEADPTLRLYTPSENSIGWIAQHLTSSELPAKIDLFKNKAKFRDLLAHLYPDFYYRSVSVPELFALDAKELPFPCIIKPVTGFFSLGVYQLSQADDLDRVKTQLENDLTAITNLYPTEVLNTQSFIIEAYVQGDEYAVDAYFDADGNPVILGILQHLFSSDQDVSDRVYMTSAQIVEENLDAFSNFLQRIGELTDVKNFPMHVELRRSKDGSIFPIEINPMRFGGWCTTADLAHHAWNFNPYEYYLLDKKPDWRTLLQDAGESIHALIVLDNSTGIAGKNIKSFDYEWLMQRFSHPLELRKIDVSQFPLFGFVFVRVDGETLFELTDILHDDLRTFITVA